MKPISNKIIFFSITLFSLVFTYLYINTASEHHIRYIIRAFLFIFLLYSSVFFFARAKLKNSKLNKLNIIIAHIIVCFITIICFNVFLLYNYFASINSVVNVFDIIAVLQTNFAELTEFLSTNNSLKINSIAIAIVFSCIAFIIGFVTIKTNLQKSKLKYASIIALVFIAGSIIAISRSQQFKLLYVAINDVKSQSITFNSVANINYHVSPKKDSELYVLVIGESSNRNFMGIYNDNFINTTPKLNTLKENNKLFLLDNPYACIPSTVSAISYALTPTSIQENPSASFNNFDYRNNLISILQKANVDVTWISNQEKNGLYIEILSDIAESANSTYFVDINETANRKPDWVALSRNIKNVSFNNDKTNLIIIHLNGSHFTYSRRYPNSYKRFNYESPAIIGNLDKDEKNRAKLNDYINSIYYSDEVLYNIYQTFSSNKNFMGLLFFSDHSEDFVLGHGVGMFTPQMSHIPAFFILSDMYKNKYPEKVVNLKQNLHKPWINDNVFFSVLDLMSIDISNENDGKIGFSIFSKPQEYNYSVENTIIPNFPLKNDPYFFIKELRTNFAKKIAYVKNPNSLFKVFELLNYDINSFEFDLVYDDSIRSFVINNKTFEKNELRLDDVLFYLDKKSNLLVTIDGGEVNLELIKKELVYLDEVYNLKSRVIINTSSDKIISDLSKDGWITSLLVEISNTESNKLIDKINKLNPQYIYYNINSYDYVHDKILPLLNKEVKHMVYYPDINYIDPIVRDKINSLKHIDNFIFNYSTNFD